MWVPAHTGGADLSVDDNAVLLGDLVPAHTGGADLSIVLAVAERAVSKSPPTRAGRI